MKLEYGAKSQEFDASGTASATKVTLVNADGAIVPILLPADKIGLSNTELFELALESLYEENFPNRAENEKFSKVAQELQKNKEAMDKAEQATTENKENLYAVSTIAEALSAVVVSQNGGIPTFAYEKVAAFIKSLVKGTRYVNGDIVAMPYPFETNDKWPKGTQTIFQFQMQAKEGYTWKEQSLSDMLQQGVLTVVMPRID